MDDGVLGGAVGKGTTVDRTIAVGQQTADHETANGELVTDASEMTVQTHLYWF